MKNTFVLVVLAVLAGVLFLTNPSMGDFQSFVREHSQEILLRETGDNALGRVLSDLGASLAGGFVDRVTKREDYFLFSTYTIGDLQSQDGQGREAEADEDRWRFLGIAGQFLQLEKPDDDRDGR